MQDGQIEYMTLQYNQTMSLTYSHFDQTRPIFNLQVDSMEGIHFTVFSLQ